MMRSRKIIITIIKSIAIFYSIIIMFFSIIYVILLPIILYITDFILILLYSITKGMEMKMAIYISSQVAKENLNIYKLPRVRRR